MFENAELGHRVSREEYDREAPLIRADLLDLQEQLKLADFPVLLIVAGVDGAGKSETANHLLWWMDARGIETHAFGDPTDEERERPRFWRYWRALPQHGKIGILFNSWYSDPMDDRVDGRISVPELDQELERIVAFEEMLVHDGALVLKFWLHITRDAQRARLKALRRDPRQSWRVTDREWEAHKHYDDYRQVAERVLRKTSQGETPWHVVDGSNERFRTLTVTRILRDALRERLAEFERRRAAAAPPPPAHPVPAPVNALSSLDLTLAMEREAYQRELLDYQGTLNRLIRSMQHKRRSLLLVFEGPDAAGKGGAIRRLTAAMDARDYRVISIAAPNEEERAHPYLWRFWRHLPQVGRVTVFDRSWYGRVLVERIEGFCSTEDWRRAYAEINDFEEQLHEFGIVVVKFWLAISADEQMLRFREREETPHKRFKMTDEDWRNREKWGAYEAAACDMIERTSTDIAPWTLVEANDKRWARVKVLRTICERLQQALETPVSDPE